MLHVAPTTMSTQPAILVRGAGPAIAEQVRRIVTALDPQAKVATKPLANNIEARLKDYRVGSELAWAGGFLALALAAFGLFGVFAFVVEGRRREIGIRVALGAQKMQVLRMLFGTTRLATLCGLGGGLLLSLGIGPLMGTYLYGLHPFDPIAFAGVAAILTVAGVLATLLPARRALAVDPAITLRQDT
jgi:predicted lysophospholipase L1 biosynthesis ABC-type transport system permease subunit